MGNPQDARLIERESAPLMSNMSEESRKIEENVEIVRTRYHNFLELTPAGLG